MWFHNAIKKLNNELNCLVLDLATDHCQDFTEIYKLYYGSEFTSVGG